MSDGERTWTGGCNCGAVRYRVRGALLGVTNCHCHQCRRFHGHVGAYCKAEKSQFELTEAAGLKWYRSSGKGRRGFCADCGSSLFGDFEGEPQIYITPGTLDDDRGLTTLRHIFMDHRGHYYEVSDGLPQLGEYD